MTVIPFGLVTVPVAGQRVRITPPAGTLPPSGGVSRIEVSASPDATGTVRIVDWTSGNIAQELLPITPGNVQAAFWTASAGKGRSNCIDPTRFALDADVSGEGANVTLYLD